MTFVWHRSLLAKVAYDLVPNDFYQYALASSAIKLAVENLLPGTKVELSPCNRDHHLPSHDLTLDMGVCIVFPGVVMPVLSDGLVRRQA